MDAFQSLVRNELVVDGPASEGKENTFEDTAQAVVDEIMAARRATPNFKVEESEPPAAKKRKTKNGVDYLKIVSRLENPGRMTSWKLVLRWLSRRGNQGTTTRTGGGVASPNKK